jgi:hypothetical protein
MLSQPVVLLALMVATFNGGGGVQCWVTRQRDIIYPPSAWGLIELAW